jgi:3-phenylpropionate/trans-cinnamate dioxygenase ferredoxin reductase component
MSSKYIILGGGMVAGYAAKELASRGLGSGDLTIISADDSLPYERPPLSKSFLSGRDTEDGILINKLEWYEKQGINVKLRTTIDKIDPKKKRLHADSGEVFEYGTLLIATGARARKLDCPGNDSPNVFYLRSLSDSRKIREKAATSKQAVVIGGGFIGMEVASVLSQKNIETSLIIREDRVCERVFTPTMSEFFERYYLARGVKLLKKESVASLQMGDRLDVSLSTGRKISCDMVVAGVGASPVTELFSTSGLAIANGIIVNEYLETNHTGISAAGDVANYVDKLFDKRRRVEHWDNAVTQGQHWAGVILGERQPFLNVPYFFSDVFDLSYELWGDSEGATQIIVRGDSSSSSFSIWWLKRDCLIAAFVMNRPEEERQCAPDWIKSKQIISADRLKDQNRPIQEAISQN